MLHSVALYTIPSHKCATPRSSAVVHQMYDHLYTILVYTILYTILSTIVSYTYRIVSYIRSYIRILYTYRIVSYIRSYRILYTILYDHLYTIHLYTIHLYTIPSHKCATPRSSAVVHQISVGKMLSLQLSVIGSRKSQPTALLLQLWRRGKGYIFQLQLGGKSQNWVAGIGKNSIVVLKL